MYSISQNINFEKNNYSTSIHAISRIFFSVQHLEELILDENLRITKIESETARDALKIVYDKVLHDLVDSEKVQKLKEILNLLQKNSRKRNDLGLVFNGYRQNPSFLTSVSRTDNFNLVKRIVDR